MKRLVIVALAWVLSFGLSAEEGADVLSLSTGYRGVAWGDPATVLASRLPAEHSVLALGNAVLAHEIEDQQFYIVRREQVIGAYFGPLVDFSALTARARTSGAQFEKPFPLADGLRIGMSGREFTAIFGTKVTLRQNRFKRRGTSWNAFFSANYQYADDIEYLSALLVYKDLTPPPPEVEKPRPEPEPGIVNF
jgi:hypothetical protein